MIQNYDDFVAKLLEVGFSLAGGRDEGVYSLINFNWNEEPAEETPVRWHTGDPETDPWEWRMRVLEEREDIAYAKVFLRKGGYITREWYPCFLAARRQGKSLQQAYADGGISHTAKRIYEIVAENEPLPLHAAKQLGQFSREDSSRFDRALVELQMKLYLTMCGRRQKQSKAGEEYGWSSTVFCTTETAYGAEAFQQAAAISPQAAAERITERIMRLNPGANPAKVRKFIAG